MLYGLNDICIIPATVSDISSRSECNPYFHDNEGCRRLPLFTAPMSCIISDANWKIFSREGINTIIPRNIDLNIRMLLAQQNVFSALSLSEFEILFVNNRAGDESTVFKICIDLANGHMSKLIRLCKEAKEYYGDRLQLMTGNIANPETYLKYAKAGIDYVRIGIGSGNVCTTSANGGIHYPMASLIQECFKQKLLIEENFNTFHQIYGVKTTPKIIADGGFKNFDQIIKALALGADYCMLGEIFAKSWEACGQVFMHTDSTNPIVNDLYLSFFEKYGKYINFVDNPELEILIPHREYYGMSTKRAQGEFGNTELKTSEGISKIVKVDYTLSQWIENFIHYLKSAMSYTNSRTLNEFKQAQTEVMSTQAFTAYYK